MDLNEDRTDLVYPSVEFQITSNEHPTDVTREGGITVSIDPPMSFRDRHRLLNEAYDRHSDPEQISAKELGYVSRQVGLCMEEVHAWFEDESQRRYKLLAKFQRQNIIEPRPCSPESMSSYAPSQRIISTTNGSTESTQLDVAYYSQAQSIFSGPSSPGTVTGDYLQVPSRVRRGRPPRTDSSSPPQPKRQKTSCQYPCFDCGKAFPADRWSEHVKRVHFPDYIWECPKTNERTGKPCSANPFFRIDNFTTHLRGEHRCEEPEISRLKTSCKFEVFGFFHKICGICSVDLKNRDESIEHTKEHLREISRRRDPPLDLGLSEWTESCGVEHKLKRGVHYQLEEDIQQQEVDVQGKDGDGDADGSNNEDQSRPGSDQSGYSSFHGGDDYSFGGFSYSQDFDYAAPYRGPGGLQDFGVRCSGVRSPELSLSNNGPLSPTFTPYQYSPFLSLPKAPYLTPSASHDTRYDYDEVLEHGRCPILECGRVFKDLKAHMLTHQNERPEKCPIQTCDYHVKGFARKYDKNRHTLTHYKGTMVCGFCSGSGSAAEKSFNRADVFKRHLTSVHGVEQTPPNSRKKSTTAVKGGSRKTLSGYASDATGKCSTCCAIFSNAQDFYEHLDDCVLRIVQQELPAKAVNAARLAEFEQDAAVGETLRTNSLPTTDVTRCAKNDEHEVDAEDEDIEDEIDDEHDDDYAPSSRARASRKRSANPVSGVQKSRGLTHSKGGVTLSKGRRKRKDYPSSWGCPTSKLTMKKRVLAVFDGHRRLWKDDMMLDNDYEVRMKLAPEKAYVTDLDVQTLRRADNFHASSSVDKGP
ncbi:hypothetical protein ONS95_004305 [Cadophora gregata]|uniref:uncharacterized protein n=2 Tax=Cadophora gregata TaxID=51156 RepID=UPI0026DD9C2D|nr:uncharacterized protein ONS95_004305 [Cadophora gregata]KAK0105788.1 hypothetical protein ONS95_004305 [Cadophora gregata]